MCRVLLFQGIYCFERRGWEEKKKMRAPKEKVMPRVLWEGREMTNSFRGLLRKYP